MRDPRLLAAPGRVGVYHLCSRIVDKRFVIKRREKLQFMELARGGAAFAGIELLSWCVMDNHFHLLVRVPPVDAEAMSDDEILCRLSHLYSENKCEYLRAVWERCGDLESRARFLFPYRQRLGNLSDFMKTLKQRFSQWYNRRKSREGTLWEGRFRSVLLEHEEGDQGLGPLVRFVAGYIDLNPVRAGMVASAEQSRWNGFGAAVRGDDLALAGLRLLWGEGRPRRPRNKDLVARHRRMLEKDEPFGAMWEESSREGLDRKAPHEAESFPVGGRADPEARESGDESGYCGGLPSRARMSQHCPEVSRSRSLGGP